MALTQDSETIERKVRDLVASTNGDGTKNTDVHLYVYDEAGKDDSPGPKCSARVGSKT